MIPEPVPQTLIDFFHAHTSFIVVGHQEPDGDCVGSQLALCSLLRRMGKKALPCSAGPFKRPEIKKYEALFIQNPDEDQLKDSALIVVDASDLERTGSLAERVQHLPSALIDHHASSNRFAHVVFLDPKAPSVTYMILSVFQKLGMDLKKEEAELLFFGLCTDTGFFRHVDDKGSTVFEYASRMIEAGANPKQTFLAMNGGKSLESRKLMGIVLGRTEAFFKGKLLLSYETLEETQKYGLEGRDSDMLYQLLQSVAGTEAIVVIRQETEEFCTVGLRSLDTVDVSAIAAQFGGGGHKQASGLRYQGNIEEIRTKIIAAFGEVL